MLKKSLSLATALFLSSMTLLQAEEVKAKAENPKSMEKTVDKEHIIKLSETFGNFIGRTIKELSGTIPFDIESIVKGIRQGLNGEAPPMSEAEYEQAVMELRQNVLDEKGEENLKQAEDFIKTKSQEANVRELEKGKLYYLIVNEGKGTAVKEHASPQIEYQATFMDGQVFSQSEANEPITISLDKTIPGFTKGLLGAKEGEKRRIFIHPELAYGKRGDLPPNSLLIFDITVVKADTDEAQHGDEHEMNGKNDTDKMDHMDNMDNMNRMDNRDNMEMNNQRITPRPAK